MIAVVRVRMFDFAQKVYIANEEGIVIAEENINLMSINEDVEAILKKYQLVEIILIGINNKYGNVIKTKLEHEMITKGYDIKITLK